MKPRRLKHGAQRATFALLLFLMPPDLTAQWQLVSETPRHDLGHKSWQVTRKVKAAAELSLSLIFFEADSTHVEVVVQSTTDRSKAKTLPELAEAHGALAACNGGYFSPEFGPDGLEISQGVRRGAWQTRENAGVFGVSGGRPFLRADREFVDSKEVSALVQCSPLLVKDGVSMPRSGGVERVARSFIATDDGNHWVIGFCPRATLDELADALVSPAVLPGFGTRSALNLDGGPSSAQWWRLTNGAAQSMRPAALVRNVILICPKP